MALCAWRSVDALFITLAANVAHATNGTETGTTIDLSRGSLRQRNVVAVAIIGVLCVVLAFTAVYVGAKKIGRLVVPIPFMLCTARRRPGAAAVGAALLVAGVCLALAGTRHVLADRVWGCIAPWPWWTYAAGAMVVTAGGAIVCSFVAMEVEVFEVDLLDCHRSRYATVGGEGAGSTRAALVTPDAAHGGEGATAAPRVVPSGAAPLRASVDAEGTREATGPGVDHLDQLHAVADADDEDEYDEAVDDFVVEGDLDGLTTFINLVEQKKGRAFPRLADWRQELARLKEQAREDFASKYKEWRQLRKRVLLSMFIMYVAICVVVPVLFRSSVSCNNGFFWEQHAAFITYLFLSKFVELYLFANDEGLEGSISFFQLALFVATSCLGQSDGYQDAVSIQIAGACARSRDVDAVGPDGRDPASMFWFDGVRRPRASCRRRRSTDSRNLRFRQQQHARPGYAVAGVVPSAVFWAANASARLRAQRHGQLHHLHIRWLWQRLRQWLALARHTGSHQHQQHRGQCPRAGACAV